MKGNKKQPGYYKITRTYKYGMYNPIFNWEIKRRFLWYFWYVYFDKNFKTKDEAEKYLLEHIAEYNYQIY